MDFENIVLNSPYYLREAFINLYGYKLSRNRFNKDFKTFYEDILSHLNQNQKLLHELKLNSLIRIFSIANQTKYYNRIFNEFEIKLNYIDSFDVLQKIPFLTKEIIRNNFEDLKVPNVKVKTFSIHHTSGTTGPKFEFLLPNKLKTFQTIAFHYRLYHTLGIQPFDKRVTIGGRRFTNKAPFYSHNYFENQLLISSHHINEKTINSLLNAISKFKPVYMQGHPNSFLKIAKFILENDITPKFATKGIFTTGETLLNEHRHLIEKAFGCKLLQQYGSGENVVSAYEDISQDYYLEDMEKGHIELVKNKQGLYEIVGTSFLNDVMPFIRYKMNDFAQPAPINYKKTGLPIAFSKVIGRTDDIIKNYKNEEILPVTIRMLMKDYIEVMEEFQFVQIDLFSFEIRFSSREKKRKEAQIEKEVKKLVGERATLNFCYNQTLMTSGGKIRNVISRI
jgi:phenylacetate-CoA ligase